MKHLLRSNGRRWTALLLLFVLIGGIVASFCASGTENVWPKSGDKTTSSGKFVVDYTNAADGYIMVKAPTSKKKLKIRIKQGDEVVNYDINGEGQYEVYPLRMGSGSYSIILNENTSGKQYAQKAKLSIKVQLNREDAAYLCPSQYVWYTEDSPAVAMSHKLCDDLETDAEKLAAVRNYMKANFLYDYIRSVTQKTTYLGDVDGVFESGKGLCLDFACILACMLRIQGIPCQVVVGEVTSASTVISHAWNLVLIDGEYIRVDITAEISGSNNVKYTQERSY